LPNEELETAAETGGGRLGTWRFPGFPLLAAVLLALLALLPFAHLGLTLPYPAPEVWAQIRPRLPELFSNSLGLVAATVLASGLLGTGLAWLTALCEFPGRRFFSWALLLPLAIPAYVLGFVGVGLFNFDGPVHALWQAWQGGDAGFPAVRSAGGLTLSLSLSLYPYVYLAARHAFQTHSGRAMEAARSLGAGPYGAFFRIALPMALPWIGTGLALVALETLADLGTASVFHYETFTTALYQAWSGPPPAWPVAARLAGVLLLLAFALPLLDWHQRQRQGQYRSLPNGGGRVRTAILRGPLGYAAALCAGLALAAAFVIPLGQLLGWSAATLANGLDGHFADACWHSVLMACGGAGLIVAAALALGLARRRHPGAGVAMLARLATMGHALPGAVLAVGIAIPVAALEQGLADLAQSRPGSSLSPVLENSLGVLLSAYLIRFLAVGFRATDSALRRITPNMEDAARSLGVHGFALWRQLRLPLLRGGLLGAFLFTFADIMREMPMTLLLRPAGWDTLTARIFETATQGQWQQAALPALALVLAGLPPVILLALNTENRHA